MADSGDPSDNSNRKRSMVDSGNNENESESINPSEALSKINVPEESTITHSHETAGGNVTTEVNEDPMACGKGEKESETKDKSNKVCDAGENESETKDKSNKVCDAGENESETKDKSKSVDSESETEETAGKDKGIAAGKGKKCSGCVDLSVETGDIETNVCGGFCNEVEIVTENQSEAQNTPEQLVMDNLVNESNEGTPSFCSAGNVSRDNISNIQYYASPLKVTDWLERNTNIKIDNKTDSDGEEQVELPQPTELSPTRKRKLSRAALHAQCSNNSMQGACQSHWQPAHNSSPLSPIRVPQGSNTENPEAMMLNVGQRGSGSQWSQLQLDQGSSGSSQKSPEKILKSGVSVQEGASSYVPRLQQDQGMNLDDHSLMEPGRATSETNDSLQRPNTSVPHPLLQQHILFSAGQQHLPENINALSISSPEQGTSAPARMPGQIGQDNLLGNMPPFQVNQRSTAVQPQIGNLGHIQGQQANASRNQYPLVPIQFSVSWNQLPSALNTPGPQRVRHFSAPSVSWNQYLPASGAAQSAPHPREHRMNQFRFLPDVVPFPGQQRTFHQPQHRASMNQYLIASGAAQRAPHSINQYPMVYGAVPWAPHSMNQYFMAYGAGQRVPHLSQHNMNQNLIAPGALQIAGQQPAQSMNQNFIAPGALQIAGQQPAHSMNQNLIAPGALQIPGQQEASDSLEHSDTAEFLSSHPSGQAEVQSGQTPNTEELLSSNPNASNRDCLSSGRETTPEDMNEDSDRNTEHQPPDDES